MKASEKLEKEFRGKRILILGLGLLGRGVDVARVFARIGAKTLVTDIRQEKNLQKSLKKLKGLPIQLRLGEHSEEDILNSQAIIRNPAVPLRHPMLKLARKIGIPIYMDSALFARYFPGRIVGITGTRGKTTTTMMIYELLKSANQGKVILAGNATKRANISLLSGATQDQIAVAELSSWELQGWREEKKSPQIAVVTNIYQDHLNRYRNMDEYVRDKEAIFSFQNKSDSLVLNRQNRWTKNMAKKTQSRVIWFSDKDIPAGWALRIIGKHNRENAAAAKKVSGLLNINMSLIKSVITSFEGVRHRLEKVAEIDGVTFINDTTATTPIAALKALESTQKPLILLVGGNSKNLSTKIFARAILENTKAVVLLKGNGTDQLKIEMARIGKTPVLADKVSFTKAVRIAAEAATPGDTVLLSPGFTSFAEFNNEFERGERFRKIVKSLKSGR